MSRLAIILVGIVGLLLSILFTFADDMLAALQPVVQTVAKARKAGSGNKPGRPGLGLVKDAFSDVAEGVKSTWNSIVQRDSGPAVVDPHFSIFKMPISNTAPAGIVSLHDVYNLLVGEGAMAATAQLRQIKDKDAAKKFKKHHFDFVTFGGIFRYRSSDGLEQKACMLCVDIDHIIDLKGIIEKLRKDEYFETALIFTSPSGDGLKWVIPIPFDGFKLEDIFEAISNYMKFKYGLIIDQTGKDICRACFLPYAPDAYLNPSPEIGLRKDFDVLKWKTLGDSKPKDHSSAVTTLDLKKRVDTVVRSIEAAGIDLTRGYDAWLRLGFALADGLGEGGRSFYHRISRFYPDYSQSETDKQYSRCLRGKRSGGVTIATFFDAAKRAGIDIWPPREQKYISNYAKSVKPVNNADISREMGSKETTTSDVERKQSRRQVDSAFPTFSDRISGHCPAFIQKLIDAVELPEEADILILGSLGVLGPCLTKFYTRYGYKDYHPCLYIFIIGIASGGKGIVALCKKLVDRVHCELRQKAESEKAEYNRALKENAKDSAVEKPRQRMLYVPANSSATSVYQILADNDGVGLIIETEGDTLSESFESDYGQFSSGFRKFFEEEMFSYHRRVGDEHVEIEKPMVSAVLTGTVSQVKTLIHDPENGLYSRFGFYNLIPDVGWRNMFDKSDGREELDSLIRTMGADVKVLYDGLSQCSQIPFSLTLEQREQFIKFFERNHTNLLRVYGMDLFASSHRLAVIALRIAMILSALRLMETGSIPDTLVCGDDDFGCSMAIVDVLTKHAAGIYVGLYGGKKFAVASSEQVNSLYERLPEQFTRTEFIDCAKSVGIHPRTAEGYITTFQKKGVIARIKHGVYEKRIAGQKG